MHWNVEADAKLFAAFTRMHPLGKADYAKLAAAMGEGVTPKAIMHRIQKIRDLGEGKATATPTKATKTDGTSPATANNNGRTPPIGLFSTKRKRAAPVSQVAETPTAKRPRAQRDVKKELKPEREVSEELPFGKYVAVKNEQAKLSESDTEDDPDVFQPKIAATDKADPDYVEPKIADSEGED